MADKLLGLDLDGIKKAIIEHLALLPTVLLKPRSSFARLLASDRPLADAIPFALVLFVLSAAAGAALGLGSAIEASNVAYLAAGVVTAWVMYGIFLHGFAFVLGARRGMEYTIAAYLYVMAALQPVLVMVLSAVTWLAPGAVTMREIRGLGGSGAGQAIAQGNFLDQGWDAAVRVLASLLILVYFGIALVPAQRISARRAILASALSFVFFLVIYLAISFVGALTGTSLQRLFIDFG
jgi:hypothetical protein